MSNYQGIVHPSLLARLQTHHYAATVTIQQATEAVDAYGVATKASWANLSGHVDLSCRLAPKTQTPTEGRGDAAPYIDHDYTIAIAGYYSTITVQMRAVISAVNYDIVSVEHDGNSKTTRLQVQVVD